ncbi:hypothetical protein [Paenibacillus protaetiae]|uniref:Uncharacterized protein n=1 Tax=Paenibacillus protaetiae TaxID=2509456 RepID=A0A4P6F7Q0_9BACL|nr:hypothetical protein [Paenibacillus protaetiae]QAY66448.1 hypothetical protein ET464_08525 [Paenibacillus protaetiae]
MAATTKADERADGEPSGLQPPVQTEEELDLVKQYVLLGIVLRILDHDIGVIGSASMKLPRLYDSLLRAVQDRVLLDMAAIRKDFRSKGIKIYEQRQDKNGLEAQYVCRGYHHRFYMVWGFVKAESERVLKTYFSQ